MEICYTPISFQKLACVSRSISFTSPCRLPISLSLPDYDALVAFKMGNGVECHPAERYFNPSQV